MRASLTIEIVTPAAQGIPTGNRVTTLRWAKRLRELGHRVSIARRFERGAPDCLIALHAVKSADSVARCRERSPKTSIVVALTGTDVYAGATEAVEMNPSLETADALVALQPLAVNAIPASLRPKSRVIYQSAVPLRQLQEPKSDTFDVAVVAHLRAVKDPLLAARAARLLPQQSRVRVLHCGAALDAELRSEAEHAMQETARYVWLGARPHRETLTLIARSNALVVTSRAEGGANVVSEAVVNGVPVIATRIDGSVGLLGADYSGYFPIGDAERLADLLSRIETDPRFHGELRAACRARAHLFAVDAERASWAELLEELARR